MDTVSGSVAMARRRGFRRRLDKMERGDVLIVATLDRWGRDAIDASTTMARLAALGIRVHCLALGGVDRTSSAGRMTMNVINAVARLKRDLLIGRGRARALGTSRQTIMRARETHNDAQKTENRR